MIAGPIWSSIWSETTRSENACRSTRRSTLTFARLRLGRRVIFVQRNRAGAGVLRNLEALAGQLLAGGGEHELVVVARSCP